jgi:hypothetical protein
VSVEKAKGTGGLPYSVRWRDENGRNRRRRFASRRAAERFDERVKDLKASGELHTLDEVPKGTVTLEEYTHDVWWPEYAEVHLVDETRANYATQLDLRILPKWGKRQLRELRPAPIEAWVGQLRRQGVGDPTIIKTLAVFRAILKRAERDEEIERNPIPLVAKPKQKTLRAPKPIPPLQVEQLRARLLSPPRARDRLGRLVPLRDPRLRMMDATLRVAARLRRPAAGVGGAPAALGAGRPPDDHVPRDQERPRRRARDQVAAPARTGPRGVAAAVVRLRRG